MKAQCHSCGSFISVGGKHMPARTIDMVPVECFFEAQPPASKADLTMVSVSEPTWVQGLTDTYLAEKGDIVVVGNIFSSPHVLRVFRRKDMGDKTTASSCEKK